MIRLFFSRRHRERALIALFSAGNWVRLNPDLFSGGQLYFGRGERWYHSYPVRFCRPAYTAEDSAYAGPDKVAVFGNLYGRAVLSLLRGAAKRGLICERTTGRETVWSSKEAE